jgi:RNase P subunit RPR2
MGTMKCNEGCDPGLLERTHTVVAGRSKEYPITEYYCQGCGWEAVYEVHAKVLTVRHDARLGHFIDVWRECHAETG